MKETQDKDTTKKTDEQPIIAKRTKSSATTSEQPIIAKPSKASAPEGKRPRSRAPIIITAIVITLILAAAAVAITLIIVNGQNNQNQTTSSNDSQITTQSKKDDSKTGDNQKDDNPKGNDTTKTRAEMRDSERNQNLATFRTKLSEYATNNRGSLPTAPDDNETVSVIGFLAKDGLFTQGNNSPATASWGKFYYNYLFDKSGNTFADPSQDETDDAYNLKVTNCNSSSNGTCSTQPEGDFDEQDYTILVVVGAKCKDDVAVKHSDSNATSRHAAITYTGETDITICYDL